MRGIRFVTDESGKKKAVLIDLETWGDAWGEIYHFLLTKSCQEKRGDRQHRENFSLTLDDLGSLLISESSLQKDWLRPEEDEAWQDL